MSASLRDVATQAQVSVGTVSNFLNRPDRVAKDTKIRIEEAVAALGFVPNASARHLRAGYSRTIGLVVPDIANPFFTEIARGVEDAASARDYAVFLCNSDESAKKEKRYLNVLLQQRVRGVLITPADDRPEKFQALRERGIAVTLLDRNSLSTDQCSVAVDDVRGGELAMSHLINLGHRRIAWVTGPDSIPQCADRGLGALTAAAKAGVEVTSIRIPLMNTNSGEEAAVQILNSPELPTAIFCANDLLALGVLRKILAHGIRIPEQISIIGYDDIQFAPSAAIPLSSISQPAYQLGRTATELLLSECEDAESHAHQQVLFQPQLVVRASTALAPLDASANSDLTTRR